MREIACQFGENQRLCGIMTLSDSPSFNKSLLFLNVGFDAKQGPYRLHVQIARRAARHGLNSFRFDFGDLGYSQSGSSLKPLQTRKNEEIRAAIDYVQSTFNMDQFALVGLCSGAEDAFRYAELDTRVQGITMIDPFSYEMPTNTILEFFSYLRNGILRRVNYYRSRSFILEEEKWREFNLVHYNYMEHSESRQILSNLLGRHLKLHFIYTGNLSKLFSHKKQLWKMFPELKNYKDVALDFFPTMGHVQMLEEERKCLLKAIEKRFVKMYLQR